METAIIEPHKVTTLRFPEDIATEITKFAEERNFVSITTAICEYINALKQEVEGYKTTICRIEAETIIFVCRAKYRRVTLAECRYMASNPETYAWNCAPCGMADLFGDLKTEWPCPYWKNKLITAGNCRKTIERGEVKTCKVCNQKSELNSIDSQVELKKSLLKKEL